MCNIQIWVFLIFNFFIFKISSKIAIFIIEISIKVHLHSKYGWNNPHSHRLGLKNTKISFFAISGSWKIYHTHDIQIHVTGHIFIIIFFWNAHNNVLYQNQYQLKLPKNANYHRTVPLTNTILLYLSAGSLEQRLESQRNSKYLWISIHTIWSCCRFATNCQYIYIYI